MVGSAVKREAVAHLRAVMSLSERPWRREALQQRRLLCLIMNAGPISALKDEKRPARPSSVGAFL
jgi:hypothetical protein